MTKTKPFNSKHIFVDTSIPIGGCSGAARFQEDANCLHYLYSLTGKRLFISTLGVARLISMFQKKKKNDEIAHIARELQHRFNVIYFTNQRFNPDRKPNPHAYEMRYFYQNVWTKYTDGQLAIFNENFFRDLSDCRLEWTLLKNGYSVKMGVIEDLDILPQHTATISLPLNNSSLENELLLNVRYVLKEAEGALEAGHEVAYRQFHIGGTTKVEALSNGQKVMIPFNKTMGFLNSFIVGACQQIQPGMELRPNFWRAPTDNEFGAGLQKKYRPWKMPEMSLVAFDSTQVDGHILVSANYKLPTVNCRLELSYDLEPSGELKVTEALTTDSTNRVPNMFRYGMMLEMQLEYNRIEYYGRGPWENFVNRNSSSLVGIYRQSVDEQFYPYVRAQETGSKTDVRWWRVLNAGGTGLEFSAEQLFCASSLHYAINQLDAGEDNGNIHSADLKPQPFTQVCIDLVQMGLECIDSWSAQPSPEFQLPYMDRTFTLTIHPYTKNK